MSLPGQLLSRGFFVGFAVSWFCLAGNLSLIQSAEPQPAAAVPVETLLPARTLFFWQDDGSLAHATAYSKTAASDALSATGAYDAIGKVLFSMIRMDSDPAGQGEFDLYLALIRQGLEHGFSFAVSLPDGPQPGVPTLTLVLHQGGPLTKKFAQLTALDASSRGANAESPPAPPIPEDVDGDSNSATASVQDFKERPLNGRAVLTISALEFFPWGTPTDEFSFWDERGHLVLTLGPDAAQRIIAIADNQAANISTHRLWKPLHQVDGQFSRRAFGWVDITMARKLIDDVPLDVAGAALAELAGGSFGVVKTSPVVASPSEINLPVPPLSATTSDESVVAPAVAVAADEPQIEAVSVSRVIPGPVLISEEETLNSLPVSGAPVLEETLPVRVRDDADSLPPPVVIADEPTSVQFPVAAVLPAVPTVDAEEVALTVDVAEESYTVKQVSAWLGVDAVDAWTWQSGYRGRAQWSESTLHTAGARRGLLGFTTTQTMTVDDLPPLPANIDSFTAMTIDLGSILTSSRSLYETVARISGHEGAAQAEKFLTELPTVVDFKTVNEVITSLDNVVCSYNDNSNGPLTFGPVVVWKLKDAAKFRAAINRLADSLATPVAKPAVKTDAPSKPAGQKQASETPSTEPSAATADSGDDDQNATESNATPWKVTRAKKYGHELLTLEGMATVAIHDQWLVCSVNPQLVEAFLLRADGKLPRWQLTEAHRVALRDLPNRFTSITVDDPRKSLPFWLSLIPSGLSLLNQTIELNTDASPSAAPKSVPFEVADFPPAELIVQPLFPNITVGVSDERGLHSYSRTSLRSFSVWDALPAAMFVGVATNGEVFDFLDFLPF